MGKRYLVEGAKLRCLFGTESSYLLVPHAHGYTADGKKKAIDTDCVPETNITGFGYCMRNPKGMLCKEYMQLDPRWENAGGASWELESVNDHWTLTMDSALLCGRGGIIVPETSGQGLGREINWEEYVKRYGDKLNIMNPGCFYDFDPINLNTGNFIYEKEDLVIHGITALSFRMTYNSMEEFQGGSIGEGWHHNYEISIQCRENGIFHLCLGDGQRIAFHKMAGTIYAPVWGNQGLLKEESEGYRYVTGKGLEYIFDSAGRIMSRKNQNGYIDTFLYNTNGMLSEVRGANGGVLHYYYNSEGNLYRVSDHTGREVRLWYSYRVLQKFINSMGQAYTYGYNENLRLESVTTPRGIVGVRNSYDSANRVIKQFTPDGGMVELRYDDTNQLTYAKDQEGHIMSYQSDDQFRNIQTSYLGVKEKFKYNDNNQIIFHEDQNGNQTKYQYDNRGYLAGITNALGGQQYFIYDKNGKLVSYTIDGKEVLKNKYDENGRLVKSTDALGRTRQTIYDDKGMPKQIIMPDGSSIKICRDERGNICSLTYPNRTVIRYQYDALNRVTEIIDSEENRIKYQYDARDHLISVINQEGAIRKYSYDESGRLKEIEDFDGGVFAISYNSMGRPEKVTDKEGRETIRNYDRVGNVIKEILPIGAVNTYKYDRNNRLIRAKRMTAGVNEAVTVVDYTYDPVGNLLKVEIGDGTEVLTTTSYEYDALNRVIATTDPVGGRKFYTYDKRSGKVSSITDALGNRITYRYNDAGELIEKIDAKGNVTRYEYNELGNVTSMSDGAGRTTRYHYLSGGRLAQIIYPNGGQIYNAYDSMGRVQKKTDGQGNSISYTYDSMGRVLQITGNGGQATSYSYDEMGNVTAVTDALGNRTEYAYTFSGKLKEVRDAIGNETEFVYDAADRLIHICQNDLHGKEQRITDYERNVFGQVECVRNAAGMEEWYRYDALGRMTSHIDRDGFKTVYAYAPDGKVESIHYDDGNMAEFQYNALRQVTLVKDWLGEIRIERNCYGEPTSITDHEGRTVYYEWGNMGERKKTTYPDGTVVCMHYDNQSHLVELVKMAEGKAGLRINYQYDAQGRLSEKHSTGGYRTVYRYNGAGQLNELIHEDVKGIIDRYCYEYDVIGNKTAVRKERRNLPEESKRYSYVYDALQRLTKVEKDGETLRSYDYDAFGNRIGMIDRERRIISRFSYDVLNRLTEEKMWRDTNRKKEDEDTCVRYTYDGRGNLTGEYYGERLQHGYLFNAMNRLEKAWNKDGEESIYLYNGLGHRIGKNSNDAKENYLLDLTKAYNNLLCIENGGHSQKFYWDYGVVAMDEEGKKSRYYLPDELGSPLRVLSDTGYGDSYGYDEFGRDIYNIEQEESVKRYSRQGEGQPFGYTGYRYDKISGTHYAQAREYRPKIGRFIAEDSKKGNGTFPHTLNLYGYCWNNPIRYVDLNGREPEIPEIPELSPFLVPNNEPAPTVPSLSDMLDLTPKQETIPDGMDELFKLPDITYTSPKTEDDNKEKNDGFSCVVSVGKATGGGLGFTIGGSGQVTFDTKGNIESQVSGNVGMMMGPKSDVGYFISIYPGMESVADSEGANMISGITVGAPVCVGIDLIWAREGNEVNPIGFSILLGAGEGLEYHESLSYTLPISFLPRINVFDTAESLLNWLSKFWTDSKE